MKRCLPTTATTVTLAAAMVLLATLKVQAQQPRELKGHADGVYFVAFTADGKELISASSDGPIKIRSVATGKERASIKGTGKPVAISADGKVLAVAEVVRNAGIKLYELPALKERAKVGPYPGTINALALLVDGERLAIAGNWGHADIWDPLTNKSRMRLAHDVAKTTAVAFSPDDRLLASAGADHHVRLWDWAREKEIAKLPDHLFPATPLAFSPDSKTLATAKRFRKPFQLGQEQDVNPDSNIHLWDTMTGKERLAIAKVPARVMALAFAPDGKSLASASVDSTIRIWDTATGQERAVLKGHRGHVLCLAFSPDGKTLASGAGSPVKDKEGHYTAGELRLWDVSALGK